MSAGRTYIVYVEGVKNGTYQGKEYRVTHSDPREAEEIGKEKARKEGFEVERATVELP